MSYWDMISINLIALLAMGAYGACVQTHMPDVQKGACAAQLEALAACVFPNALGRR